MTLEELQKFCSKNPVYAGRLDKPFLQDGVVWATDGHVIIGVPPMFGVRKNPDAPIISKIKPAVAPIEWFPIPEIQTKTCSFCGGEVKGFTCPECDGHGRLTFQTKWHIYENHVQCASCDEDGEIEFCPYCCGTGVEASEFTTIGGVTFTGKMLQTIKDLPEIEISPTGPESPAYLRFADGGVGYLMPGKEMKS